MMSGMPLETCSAFNKFWNNKFYYKVASCWLFLLIQYRNMHRGELSMRLCVFVLMVSTCSQYLTEKANEYRLFK